jgi:putative MATE family efflux protein
MLAATGVLRGLQDTRTPLLVAVVGTVLNIVLNVVLVYGLHLGIAGSALGSVIAQVLSAAALIVVVVRAAREQGAPLSPDRAGIRTAAHAAVALVIRTLALRACLLVGTYAVTRVAADSTGVNLATHQIAITFWTFLAFALDAIAIAAQALTGRALGSGDVEVTRQLTSRMIRWGWASGVVAGLLLAASAPFVGALFTSDPAVRQLLVPVLLVAAIGQPLAGVVYVLDGILIGAGDVAFMRNASIVAALGGFVPVTLAAAAFDLGLGGVWAGLATFIVLRLVAGLVRFTRGRWAVAGAPAGA